MFQNRHLRDSRHLFPTNDVVMTELWFKFEVFFRRLQVTWPPHQHQPLISKWREIPSSEQANNWIFSVEQLLCISSVIKNHSSVACSIHWPQRRTHLCIDAAVAQRPRFTRVLAHGKHDGGVGFTDLFTEERTSRRDQLHLPSEHRQRGLKLTWLGWNPWWRDRRGRRTRQPGPLGSACQCTSPTTQNTDRSSLQSTSWQRRRGQSSAVNTGSVIKRAARRCRGSSGRLRGETKGT